MGGGWELGEMRKWAGMSQLGKGKGEGLRALPGAQNKSSDLTEELGVDVAGSRQNEMGLGWMSHGSKS